MYVKTLFGWKCFREAPDLSNYKTNIPDGISLINELCNAYLDIFWNILNVENF